MFLKPWEKSADEIAKVPSDPEMARDMLDMARVRIRALSVLEDGGGLLSIRAECYYEIIKECLVALMVLDGYKTLSHEVLIGYMAKFLPEFSTQDVQLVDKLRMMRNRALYRGVFIPADFMIREEPNLRRIMDVLLSLLEEAAG